MHYEFLEKMKALLDPQFKTKQLNSVKDSHLLHVYENFCFV